VLNELVQQRRGRGPQEPAKTALGEFSGGGGDEDESVRIDGALAGGTAEVGQRRHRAHGVTDDGQWRGDIQGSKYLVEVSSEPIDPIGADGSGARAAVTAVVVGDDPGAVAVTP
jgi:hypothetical protein